MNKIKNFSLILLTMLSVSGFSQNKDLFIESHFIKGSDTLPVRILYPENFDQNKKYPVIFFLHGRGESGSDNQKQLTNGSKMFLSEAFRKNHQSIVIFPQCDVSSYWANVEIDVFEPKRFFSFRKGGAPTKAMNMLVRYTDYIANQSFTDKNRMYIGGLSMGGMGTLEMLRRKPKTFAAAFAICGGDHPSNTGKYKDVPLWLFHGGLDDVVPPLHSFLVYKTLKDMGRPPKFTLYPKANHNSWDLAFAEPELLNWVFSHSKNR